MDQSTRGRSETGNSVHAWTSIRYRAGGRDHRLYLHIRVSLLTFRFLILRDYCLTLWRISPLAAINMPYPLRHFSPNAYFPWQTKHSDIERWERKFTSTLRLEIGANLRSLLIQIFLKARKSLPDVLWSPKVGDGIGEGMVLQL